MKQTLIGGLVGGVILFLWGFLAWSVLMIHKDTLKNIPNEDIVMSALGGVIHEKGVYVFPGFPQENASTTEEEKAAAMSSWEQKYRRGPTGQVIYDPKGSDPIMMSQMITGLLLTILGSMLVAWFLQRSTAANASYLARVSFCGMFGIFLALGVHLVNWNWMGYPFNYTTSIIVDNVVGWVLAGLGIAAVVKRKTGTA